MAEVLAPGALVIDMSSSAPLGTRKLAEELAARASTSSMRRSRAASSAQPTVRWRSWLAAIPR